MMSASMTPKGPEIPTVGFASGKATKNKLKIPVTNQQRRGSIPAATAPPPRIGGHDVELRINFQADEKVGARGELAEQLIC
jgi:hypothetical protein